MGMLRLMKADSSMGRQNITKNIPLVFGSFVCRAFGKKVNFYQDLFSLISLS